MNTELSHYGVKGMKWGVRRYRNSDGTLTSAGRKKYAPTSSDSSTTKRVKKDLASLSESEFKAKYFTSPTTYMKRVDRYGDPYMNSPLAKAGKFMQKQAQNNADRAASKIGKGRTVRKATKYQTKMLDKSQKRAERANASTQSAKAALDDLNKWGKQSDYYSEYEYETLRDAIHDYTYSIKNSTAAGKAWLSVNKTLQNTDVNTVSKKEMTQTIKAIIEEAKRENKGWTYY